MAVPTVITKNKYLLLKTWHGLITKTNAENPANLSWCAARSVLVLRSGLEHVWISCLVNLHRFLTSFLTHKHLLTIGHIFLGAIIFVCVTKTITSVCHEVRLNATLLLKSCPWCCRWTCSLLAKTWSSCTKAPDNPLLLLFSQLVSYSLSDLREMAFTYHTTVRDWTVEG